MIAQHKDDYICFIDFETTGSNVFDDEPIELGAVLVDSNLEIVDTFSSRIRISPDQKMTAAAFKIHQLSPNELFNAPEQAVVLAQFFNTMGVGYRMAGWNIGFDITFFRRLCNDHDLMNYYNQLNYRHIDLQTMNFLANELSLFPVKTKSFTDIATLFKLERALQHSAKEDAELSRLVYINLLRTFKQHNCIHNL